MKKAVALILTLLMILTCTVGISAEPNYGGLNSFMKSSRSDFEGQGVLSKTVLSICSFDSQPTGMNIANGAYFDTANKVQGTASLKYVAKGGKFNSFDDYEYKMHSMFSGNPGARVSVTNIMSQAIGMWLYVDNIDNLVCDHDDVYDRFQQNCGTIYFRFGNSSSNYQQWNHTFYGNGWHYIEFAFNSRENSSPNVRDKIIYNNMGAYMQLLFETQGKNVTVNVDEISLITYTSSSNTPIAPYGGKWVSTCDYDQFDGSTVTEWMGAYFDKNNKKQGSSSLMVRGRGEHVDYRAVFAGYTDKNFVLDLNNEYLIFDLYCSDAAVIGEGVDFVFYDILDTGNVSVPYALMSSCAEGGSIKNGWNHIKVPLDKAKKNKVEGDTFKAERLKIYWHSTDRTTWYTVGYDNMYTAPKKNVDNPNWKEPKPVVSSPVVSKPSSVTSSKNETSSNVVSSQTDKDEQMQSQDVQSVTTQSVLDVTSTDGTQASLVSNPNEQSDNKMTLWIIIGTVSAIVIAAAITTVMLIKKKKKPIHKEN
ncbi:MAG: hypothetical protein IJ462_00890 [Clostridia bacterium]|nr:hypothetical protein [Clostridia bacterium]